ncbi:MAG: GMC oxidoreductase, partial [Myxococcota bacterium]|nr:GMC oxidoreductase [Myxococcota bacterium]
ELVVPSVYGFPICRSMDEVLAATPLDLPPSRLLLYASHPQSSCAVGRALDRDGELPQAPGVFVFDAAALPSNVGRNPQISVMTLARVLSLRLAEKLGGTPISLTNEPAEGPDTRGP